MLSNSGHQHALPHYCVGCYYFRLILIELKPSLEFSFHYKSDLDLYSNIAVYLYCPQLAAKQDHAALATQVGWFFLTTAFFLSWRMSHFLTFLNTDLPYISSVHLYTSQGFHSEFSKLNKVLILQDKVLPCSHHSLSYWHVLTTPYKCLRTLITVTLSYLLFTVYLTAPEYCSLHV